MSSLLGKLSKILRDYCENTSLVGLGYVSNKKIHITERIFWLICIVISAGGSYFLIREYQNSFESKAISLVIEGTTPQDKTLFPAIGICEDGAKSGSYPKMTAFVKDLHTQKRMTEASYAIEDFLMRIVFENMYTGGLDTYFKRFLNCDDCVKCPTSGYKEISDMVRRNCSQLIVNCSWNNKNFNCCDYFLPLQTPIGRCFILNSKQTTERFDMLKNYQFFRTDFSRNGWLKMETGWDIGFGKLQVDVTNPIQMHLLNSEDVPSNYLRDYKSEIDTLKTNQEIQLSVQRIINDPDVREISPEYRRCRFPDENLEGSGYKYYSFTSCVTDCLKKLQIQTCNCTSYNYLVKSDDKSPACDYDGFMCLSKQDVFRPSPTILQPWRSNGLMCKCLPSCTEHEINIAGSSSRLNNSAKYSSIKITQTVATQQYRRQAVRTQLDVVVTIGGILGLFMGASILSGIEILYFFFVRICNSKKEDN